MAAAVLVHMMRHKNSSIVIIMGAARDDYRQCI